MNGRKANTSKKAAVIILSHNGLRFLPKCLFALRNQTYKNFELYFVDNGSTDGTSEYVRKIFPAAKLLRFEKNTGFARGNNEAINEAFKDSEISYIVCLNNDTIVDKNWLKELIFAAQKDNKIGAVGSVGIYPNGRIQNAGIRLLPSRTFVEMREGDLSLGYGESPQRFKKTFEIFAPSGFSALYKRASLLSTGLFDEDFFAFCEDIDFGFRLRRAGYISVCNPKSKLIHFHSMTGGRASPLKAFLSKRNGFFVAIKNFPSSDLLLYPFRDAYLTIFGVHSKEQREKLQRIGAVKSAAIMLRVYLSVIFYLPKMIIKRSVIRRNVSGFKKKSIWWFNEKN
ncbi:Glycosyltransferase AglE [uncultured archaeon]|nr:Glycosyltransferase AglE [uncultured archaeon]